MSTPHLCPKCHADDKKAVGCNVCHGAGIVWEPPSVAPMLPYPYPYHPTPWWDIPIMYRGPWCGVQGSTT